MSLRRVSGLLVATLTTTAAMWGVAATTASAGLPSFDVSISNTHVGSFQVGQPGTFTIGLQFLSPNVSTGSDTFTITDVLPTGLTYASDTGSAAGFTCSAAGQTVTCTGQPNFSSSKTSLSFTVTVNVANAAVPSVQNPASFTEADESDTNPDNNSQVDTIAVLAAASPSPTPTPTPTPTKTVTPVPTATVKAIGANRLPFTGARGLEWLLAGGVLVLMIGAALTRLSRRREH